MSEERDTGQSASLITWEKFEFVAVPGVAEKKKRGLMIVKKATTRGNVPLPEKSS